MQTKIRYHFASDHFFLAVLGGLRSIEQKTVGKEMENWIDQVRKILGSV